MGGVFRKLVALGLAMVPGLLAEAPGIRWTVHLSEPELSSHQRLVVNLDVRRRSGEGQFRIFIQLTDAKGRTWQSHHELDDAEFTQPFFVLPGDYRVSVALSDGAGGENSVIKRNLHVAALKNDPLPEMWRDIPAVEFIALESASDRWYLPSVEGRLKLAVETRHLVNVDVLVNLTPAERLSASTRIQNHDMEALIPAAKVLSQVEWRNSEFSLELLDISRRRVAYRQENMQELDWPKAKSALDKVNPGIIDVRSLAFRRYSADFFLNRIRRRIGASHVVIILSTAVSFAPGVEMHPIELAPRPDLTVFYFRYQLLPTVFVDAAGRPRRAFPGATDDELAPLLKPLAPRLFEVTTPEQFRKSLALVLGRIAQL